MPRVSRLSCSWCVPYAYVHRGSYCYLSVFLPFFQVTKLTTTRITTVIATNTLMSVTRSTTQPIPVTTADGASG